MWLAGLVLFAATGACANTSSVGKTVAAEAISCPESEFAAVVPHSYNLGPGDHVYRGCGRDVIVHCLSWQEQAYCQPTYVSPN